MLLLTRERSWVRAPPTPPVENRHESDGFSLFLETFRRFVCWNAYYPDFLHLRLGQIQRMETVEIDRMCCKIVAKNQAFALFATARCRLAMSSSST